MKLLASTTFLLSFGEEINFVRLFWLNTYPGLGVGQEEWLFMYMLSRICVKSVRRRSLRERDVSGHRSAGPQHVVPRGWDSGLKHTFSYFETSSIWSHGDGDMGTEEEGGRSRAHFECFWRRPSREGAATCWPFLFTQLTDSPCPQFHFDLLRQREGG